LATGHHERHDNEVSDDNYRCQAVPETGSNDIIYNIAARSQDQALQASTLAMEGHHKSAATPPST
jgi:hypothetical protein